MEARRAKRRSAAASRVNCRSFREDISCRYKARVRRSGDTLKTCVHLKTGPWRVSNNGQRRDYGVQTLSPEKCGKCGKFTCSFAVSLRIQRWRQLLNSRNVFRHTFTQGELEVGAMVKIGESHHGSGYDTSSAFDGLRFTRAETLL